MKATGIIRRIDDLGRIVIPKEIRKTLRIKEGDQLEIYVEKNGEIILKRYAPLGDIIEQAFTYANVLSQTTGYTVCITDSKEVVAISGSSKKSYVGTDISEEVSKLLEDRETWSSKDGRTVRVTQRDKKQMYASQLVVPIIADGNAIGSVIFFSEVNSKNITDIELKLAQTAANFLAAGME